MIIVSSPRPEASVCNAVALHENNGCRKIRLRKAALIQSYARYFRISLPFILLARILFASRIPAAVNHVL